MGLGMVRFFQYGFLECFDSLPVLALLPIGDSDLIVVLDFIRVYL
jgi:hypothetical protein